jgi:hypothetical protein
MFSENLKKSVRNAIAAEKTTDNKWKAVGDIAKMEFESAAALESVRPQFLAEVIYPAMGDEAVKIIKAELPRKGSKDWNDASADQQAAWTAVKDAKKTVRGEGSVYFGRVVEYGWPTPKSNETGAQRTRDLKTRFNEELAALIKAAQNAETPPFDTGMVIGHLEAALKYVNK